MGGRVSAESVLIERSIEDVYAFLADGSNEPRWRGDPERFTELESGAPGAIGAVHLVRINRLGRTRRVVLADADPPTRVELEAQFKRKPPVRTTFELAREGGGTRLAMETRIEGAVASRLIPAKGDTATRMDRGYLERIKQMLEAPPAQP